MRSAAVDNFGFVVWGVGSRDRLIFRVLNHVVEINMVRPREIVLILFVIERPVVRIGRNCRRAHVFGDRLRVIQYLYLHGVMVTLFSAVRGAVVVLVPDLIPAVAGEGHGGKRNDCPVLADKSVARGDDAGRVEYLQHLRDLRKQSTLRWFGRTLLALIDAFMSIKRNTLVPLAPGQPALGRRNLG